MSKCDGPGDLPRPEQVGVRLARRRPPATSVSVWSTKTGTSRSLRMNVGFGAVTGVRRQRRQRRTGPAAAVHEEAVVDVHERVHRVDVRHDATGRLRLAGGEQRRRREAAEERRRVVDERLAGLGEDVVRVAVAGMRQRRVPHRVAGCREATRSRNRRGGT